jgi:hypothetical protein
MHTLDGKWGGREGCGARAVKSTAASSHWRARAADEALARGSGGGSMQSAGDLSFFNLSEGGGDDAVARPIGDMVGGNGRRCRHGLALAGRVG